MGYLHAAILCVLNLSLSSLLIKGGSRISGKGVHMYKGVVVRVANFISFFFFLNIPCGLTEIKLIHFHRIF